MCDYSLEAVKSRPAVVGEKLITTNFGRGTSGFSPDGNEPDGPTAVCLLPGTELAFDTPVGVKAWIQYTSQGGCNPHEAKTIEHKVARFAKINQDNHFTHHDGLEFPDTFGVDPVLLNHLVEGQVATVLQMPVSEQATAAVAARESILGKPESVNWNGHEYVD